MKVSQLLQSKVSFWRYLNHTSDPYNIEVGSILAGIMSGKWSEPIAEIRTKSKKKERTALKSKLPCATFSGIFAKRKESGILSYSQIITLDFDHIDSIRYAKDLIFSHPSIFCLFESPSRGIKALAVSNESQDMHKRVFAEFKEMFNNRGLILDQSGKNLDRLCFMSHDPNIILKSKVVPYSFKGIEIKGNGSSYRDKTKDDEKKTTEEQKIMDSSLVLHIDRVFITAIRWTQKTYSYKSGERNNYIHALACNTNRLGIPLEMAADLIFERYPSAESSEVGGVETLVSVYRRNLSEFNTRLVKSNKNRYSTNLFEGING